MNCTATQRALVGLVFAGALLFVGASGGAEDGRSVFVANKCNSCHGVRAAGIAKTDASSKAPELSSTGLRRSAAWITKYLKKQEDLNGVKHVKRFKGSDADLAVLAAWLAEQKKR